MEDYSPSPDEVEETPVKKRRSLRGNFLRSWLEQRQIGEEDKANEESATTAESTKADTKNKDWRPERLRDKLRNIFDNLVGLDLVPAKETESLPTGNLAEPKLSIPKADEEGLLAVSPDAQRQYYGYELMDEPGLEEESEVEVDDVETDHPIEKPNPLLSDNLGDRLTVSRSAEPVGEVLRRRQADRLERKVKKLKKQTKTIKREQAEVIEQQKGFAEQLTARQKAQERFETVTVPKMEKARQRLQERLERSTTVKSETNRVPSAEIKSLMRAEVKSEYQAELKTGIKLENASLGKQDRPEPLNRVEQYQLTHEKYPEPKIPLGEIYYERRHEVMDEPGKYRTRESDKSIRTTAQAPAPKYPPPILPPTTSQSQMANDSNLLQTSPPPGADMYKQAMKTGFWSGIVLTIILLLVLMFSR